MNIINNKEEFFIAVKTDSFLLKFASKELRTIIGNNNPIIILKDLIQIKQEKITLERKIKINLNIDKVTKIKI